MKDRILTADRSQSSMPTVNPARLLELLWDASTKILALEGSGMVCPCE